MRTRTGLKKSISDQIKFSVEQKVKSLGLDSLPKVSDISLRKRYVRITLRNTDDCNISSLQRLFPHGKIFLKQIDNDTKLEIFIETRTLNDGLLLIVIFIMCLLLIVRSYIILRRLLKL